MQNLNASASDSKSVLVPDIPHRIELTRNQVPRMMDGHSEEWKKRFQQFKATEASAEGVLLNTFEELEQGYVEGYRGVVKKIWCIGPLSLCHKAAEDKLERGKKAAIDDHHCLKWLDSNTPGSVIYLCFGSMSRLSHPQLKEIGLGLESSGRAFIWVINKQDCSTEMQKWLAEEKYEQRVEGKGLVIRGWAPQALILSHPAIGAFVTHCGWNSTLEGVSAGVPMIAWPMFAEQFLNEKLIVQVLKIGVSVGAQACLRWGPGQEDQMGPLVKKEDINRAIDEVMGEGEEKEETRKRAEVLGKMAKGTVEEGGSSCLNLTRFIRHVMELVPPEEETAAASLAS